MDSKPLIEWVQDWGPLITLAATVILSGVTAWLAYATKSMADSARQAAIHSQAAAEASAASVAISEAGVDVRFDARPRMGSTAGEMTRLLKVLESAGLSGETEVTPKLLESITSWRAVDLTCRGAAVNVHGLKITFIGLRDRDGNYAVVRGQSHDIDLQPEVDLPRLCHDGDSISFDVPDRSTDEDLAEFSGVVSYSFGRGAIRQRSVSWESRRPRGHEDGAERDEGPSQHERETGSSTSET